VITELESDPLRPLRGLKRPSAAMVAPEALLLAALIEWMVVGVHDDIVKVDRRDDADGERDGGLWVSGHRNTMWL
jgi:hypothetical protein